MKKIVKIKNLRDEEIESIIINYLKNNRDKVVYPSDIAFRFKLDARKVFEICQKLKKEGKII